MLSGNNGILQRATNAKTESEKGQEQEIVALAYNSALVKKGGNGDSTPVTSEDMNTELTNQGATASGSNTITVTFEKSRRQYTINSTGEIQYAGIKNDENNNIQLSITSTATESRAVIVEVTAKSERDENTLTESKLQELEETNPEQIHTMFVDAVTKTMNPPFELTWNWFEQTFGTTNTMNIAFTNMNIAAGGYNNAYDFIIKNTDNVRLTATFSCTGNEPVTGTSAKFIVINPNPTITATISNNRGYAEQIWNEYPDTNIETYSNIQQSNYKLEKDGYEVWIPAGFAYGTSTNVGTVATGLVITDHVEEVIVDGETKRYSDGNEFVWIPVDYNSTAGTLKVKGTEKEIAKLQDGSSTDYRGVLYNWSTDSTGNTIYSWSSTTTDYREPAILSNYDV